MKAWLTLLRREWWEHKAGFGWTPLAIGGVGTLLALWFLAMAGGAEVRIAFDATVQSGADSTRRSFEWNDALLGMLDFSHWSTPQLERTVGGLLHLMAQPFIWAHFLVALFVLPAMLNDDRRDRSVLFWKSLPVSDLATVTSKLVLVVWVAPLVTVAAILATWVAVLGLVSAFTGTAGAEGLGRLWTHAGLVSGTLGLIVGYLLQGLWTLPIYAWLLFVSAAAPRAPLVWAIIAPLVPATLERMFLGTQVLWTWIGAHLEFVALPRPGAMADGSSAAAIGFAEQVALLGSLDLWIGVAIGALLIAAATRLRARNFDL
jgi:ABC-2 type transport system permease protein